MMPEEFVVNQYQPIPSRQAVYVVPNFASLTNLSNHNIFNEIESYLLLKLSSGVICGGQAVVNLYRIFFLLAQCFFRYCYQLSVASISNLVC